MIRPSGARYFLRLMQVIWTRALTVLIVATAVVSGHPREPRQDVEIQPQTEVQLAEALREIEAADADWTRAGRLRSPRDTKKLVRGAVNFFRPFPGGNGRSCATCHNPKDGFSLSPATVEARWERLQRARRHDPDASDPLFRAIDADDGQEDFTLLRTRALFKVRVPLPSRVRLTDDPAAPHVTLARAVTPLNMLKHTAPYQQDRSAPTLEAQALAAVNQHMEPTVPPTKDFLESVAEFQRHIFSSAKVRRLSAAIDAGRPLPDLDPPLTELERRGKEKFDDLCGRCHGGPAQVQNLENRIFPPFDGSTNPVSINIVVSNPPPNGFPSSPVLGPGFDLLTQRFDVDLPNGTTVTLESSDPGTVLTDARALETVAGNQVFNRFDIPQLRGINKTAPYFHDHRATTLEEVLRHYQAFFFFINVVRGLPLPLIEDEDIEPIVAYMKKAF